MIFQELFEQGMDREVKPIKEVLGLALNVGAGNKHIRGAISLDFPEWDADAEIIPYKSGSVSTIYAYHFLEHCSDPVKVLQEFQRVLKIGGVVNICVPYYSSAMNSQDLDHKKSFTEHTWKTLFKNQYYNKNKVEWNFEVGFNLICGIVEKNLCLLTQLIKVDRDA